MLGRGCGGFDGHQNPPMREENSGAKGKRESAQRQLEEEKKADKSLECVKVQAVDADVCGITI